MGSTVRPSDDPDILFNIFVTITHQVAEQDIKYITCKRASIKENYWFDLHYITLATIGILKEGS